MEEFIPLLIGLAVFAFKIYSNFQKEQEKSLKRNPGQPAPEARPNLTPSSSTPQTDRKYTPEPFLAEERANPNNPYEPQYKSVYKEPREELKAEKLVYERINPERAVPEKAYTNTPAEEVRNNRIIHKAHPHHKAKPAPAEEDYYEFDIRDAIIKEAILNRPKF